MSTTGNSSGSTDIATREAREQALEQVRRGSASRRRRSSDADGEPRDAERAGRCGRSRAGAGSSPPAIVPRDWPILPISVDGPVAVTSARPCPETTSVPEKTRDVGVRRGSRRPRVRRALARPGTDSPVSSDSSTERFDSHRSAPSAATRSPSEHDQQVAAHDLAPGDARLLPSRITRRAGAREVPQLLERPLGPAVLEERDRRSTATIDASRIAASARSPSSEVDRAATPGAAGSSARAGPRRRAPRGRAASRGDLVGALPGEPGPRLGGGESLERAIVAHPGS